MVNEHRALLPVPLPLPLVPLSPVRPKQEVACGGRQRGVQQDRQAGNGQGDTKPVGWLHTAHAPGLPPPSTSLITHPLWWRSELCSSTPPHQVNYPHSTHLATDLATHLATHPPAHPPWWRSELCSRTSRMRVSLSSTAGSTPHLSCPCSFSSEEPCTCISVCVCVCVCVCVSGQGTGFCRC